MNRRAAIVCAAAATAVAAIVAVAVMLAAGGSSTTTVCSGARALDFACLQRRSLEVAETAGTAAALDALAEDMRASGYVRAACHQLVHRIGRAAGRSGGIGAFADGDPLCGSGYYHGVVEAVMTRVGGGAAVRRAASVCAPLRARGRYSAEQSNCVHGMGHGFMGLLGRRIDASLQGCDGLPSAWERRGCYSGVFMENLGSERRTGSLRAAEPLYPCTAVGRRYREACYERQTTYALFAANGDFDAVFALCATAERDFRGACHRGLGGDVAAETKTAGSIRDQARARRGLCMLGDNARARSDCIAGAARVILQDLDGGPAQLDALCAAFEVAATQPQHAACLRASEQGYRELLAQQTGQSPDLAAAPAGIDFVCHLKTPGARRRGT